MVVRPTLGKASDGAARAFSGGLSRPGGRLTYEGVSAQELGSEYTTMGWEIYPEGLHDLLTRLRADYGDPEMYITESGMAADDVLAEDGAVHDSYRIDYMRRYLQQTARCIEDGVRLRGYFVWTLVDSFEWEDGWGKRFGLVHLDYETRERTLEDSGRWYRDFIRQARGQPTGR